MILSLVDSLGKKSITGCRALKRFFLFLTEVIVVMSTTKLKIKKLLAQMECIGLESFYIVILTGLFTGMVFALQSYIGFQRVGGEQFIGAAVALAMFRELGPVLTGLMVTGRAGSAIAAELGTMRITEEIDALVTLQINPFNYLIVPRILAGTLILPFLTMFSMICGIIGGYFVCMYVLGLNSEDYINSIKTYIHIRDIVGGLIKSCFFGFILSFVGSYKGYYTKGGARGVGIATTQSVVTSSILILISNYFITKLLEHL
jgi:phospholipid/cholesterol/gamma-HCH transport system permease protein